MEKTIIIEDEKPAARRLQRMLQKEGINTGVLLHSVNESLQWLNHNPAPDLIFADIHLSDGLSFDIFEQIKINSPIIFTTAYNQYAIKAFKLNSIDYLLKPIQQEDLQYAINKFRSNNLQTIDIKQLTKILSNQNTYKERFSIQYGVHLKSINTSEIICFYSQDKATYLVTDTGESFLYDVPLEKIHQQLNPKEFFRVNRKFIIRHSAISDIISYSNSRLKIKLHHFKNQDIIVARERVKDFKHWLD